MEMRRSVLLLILLGIAVGAARGQTPCVKMPGFAFRRLDLSGNFIVKFDEQAVVRLEGGSRVKRLELVVKFLEGRKHLPIVEPKRAA